jgi:hypothetical protein
MNDDDYINLPIPMQYNSSIPMPQRSDRADLIDKIKPDLIVEVIRQRLLGNEWSGSGWLPVKALKEFALTERGAWEISNLMLGVSSINTSISKLKEEVIKARLKRIAKDAQFMLIANWREYGIRNTAQFYYVHNLVFTNALTVLFQAGDGSIQELLKGTVQENRNINTEKKEPGRLKRMLGLG